MCRFPLTSSQLSSVLSITSSSTSRTKLTLYSPPIPPQVYYFLLVSSILKPSFFKHHITPSPALRAMSANLQQLPSYVHHNINIFVKSTVRTRGFPSPQHLHNPNHFFPIDFLTDINAFLHLVTLFCYHPSAGQSYSSLTHPNVVQGISSGSTISPLPLLHSSNTLFPLSSL